MKQKPMSIGQIKYNWKEQWKKTAESAGVTYEELVCSIAENLKIKDNLYRVESDEARVGFTNETLQFPEEFTYEQYLTLFLEYKKIISVKEEETRLVNGIELFEDYCISKGIQVKRTSIYDPLDDSYL